MSSHLNKIKPVLPNKIVIENAYNDPYLNRGFGVRLGKAYN